MCVSLSLTFFDWWLFVRLEEERESESRTKRAVRGLGLALQLHDETWVLNEK